LLLRRSKKAGAPKSTVERLSIAGGAPGQLLGDEARGRAIRAARKLLDAALAPNESARHAAVLGVGAAGARGAFSDTLDAMLMLVGERMRAALHDADEARALRASRAADSVARALDQASGNSQSSAHCRAAVARAFGKPLVTLSHTGKDGEARMVDVSEKTDTRRVARASGVIVMTRETLMPSPRIS
jgi:hypothetical protein